VKRKRPDPGGSSLSNAGAGAVVNQARTHSWAKRRASDTQHGRDPVELAARAIEQPRRKRLRVIDKERQANDHRSREDIGKAEIVGVKREVSQ